MDKLKQLAPLLHTGFAETYTREQMQAFAQWCHDQGYAGFSVEGKANVRTNAIDDWLKGFQQGLLYAVEEAEKRGLEVWLFDEWGYPTGTAAGKALENKTEWRSKKLHLMCDLPLEAGQQVEMRTPPHFLSAAAWPVGRDIFSSPLSAPVPVPDQNGWLRYTATHKRERLCLVTWEYDCFRTVGVFKPDPEEDSQGTLDLLSYEAVAHFLSVMHESYVPLFGPYFGTTIKGFFYDEPFVSFPFPYTFDLMEEFQKRKGCDLLPRLPLMLAGLDTPAMTDYRDVCTTRAANAFYGQMADWCHTHRVELVGHQDLDHSARTLDSVSGHFFKNSAQSDGPGVDYIWAQLQPGVFSDFPRFAGSVKHLLGKAHAVSESFAATVSGKSPDYMRFCMEHQLLRGIDRFFLMIADPVEEDGHFFTPMSKSHPQSAAFAPLINRRIGLVNQLAGMGRPNASVAVYIPMDAVFSCLVNQKKPSAVSIAPYRPVWEYIDEAARLLCYAPVDFEYIWKEAVVELPLENGAFVTPAGQRISTLILPPSAVKEAQVFKKLREFAVQGGTLLFINHAPEELMDLSAPCADASEIPSRLRRELILDTPAMISLSTRYSNGRSLYFLLNEDIKAVRTTVTFPEQGHLERYDFQRECWITLEGHRHELALEGMELALYALTDTPSGVSSCELEGGFALDKWSLTLPDQTLIPLEKLVDWRQYWPGSYVGWMTYRTDFTVLSGGLYRISLGQVCYAAIARVDGEEKPLPFAPFTADYHLEAGTHHLEVLVLNTDANTYYGTLEAELAHKDEVWLHNKMGSDRKYLVSGLLGPVRIHRILE